MGGGGQSELWTAAPGPSSDHSPRLGLDTPGRQVLGALLHRREERACFIYLPLNWMFTFLLNEADDKLLQGIVEKHRFVLNKRLMVSFPKRLDHFKLL